MESLKNNTESYRNNMETLNKYSDNKSINEENLEYTETEHIICGCGELHLEIYLKDLVEDYAKVEITKSDPVVPYKETVTAKSSQICLAKSRNKHNRLYVIAEQLDEELVKEIEEGTIRAADDNKKTSRTLIDKYH